MGQQGDLFARGWEQGMRDARIELQRANGDPADAIDRIEALIVQAVRLRTKAERTLR